MTVGIRSIIALITVVVTLGFSTITVRTQGSLNAARELYAAAAYDEALTALNALAASGDAISDSPTVALYRALCLYALGRNGEGDRAVEAMVTSYPKFRPDFQDLSPRMRTTVTETRRRLLPGILQRQYADAKSAYDRQDYATASAGFKQVIEGLGDPDLPGQSGLNDLRTLASGFRDLAEKALTPAPAPTVKAAVVLPPPAAPPPAPRVYSAGDSDVTAPVAVRQNIPAFTRPVTQRKTAVVELLVDERGAVSSATMISPLDPTYDRLVVAAAKGWQYEPAKGPDGKPVKYQKRVQITLVPTEPTR